MINGFPIKHQYVSRYYSGGLAPQYLETQNIEKNNASICTKFESIVLPAWIKTNAKWWSENKINDSDFISGIEYMIKTKIILLPDSELHIAVTPSDKIPYWLKNNAEWWADGIISESEFIKSIQYLISAGIIKVN